MEVVSGDGDCGRNGRGLTASDDHYPMLVSAGAGWGFFYCRCNWECEQTSPLLMSNVGDWLLPTAYESGDGWQ